MQKKHYDFLVLLNDRTEQGRVKWEKTSEPAVFQAVVSDYSVHIFMRQSRTDSIDEDVVLSVFNDDGELIEEIDDVAVGEYIEKSYKYMKNLYEMARSSAMGVDSALSNMIDKLSTL